MTKPIPTIAKYMSDNPHTISSDQTIEQVDKMMRTHSFRHLPVMTGGKIVGIISERDVRLVETLKGVDPTEVQVADAMTPDPYLVDPDTPLDQVTAEMAEHKYGSAVIVQNGKVVGIFTTQDALLALGELLRTRLAK